MVNTERLLNDVFLRGVSAYGEITSTNDRALELAGEGTETPHLVVAERQTGGRGRGANRWWSGEGSLAFSLLLNAEAPLTPRHWPRVSLAAALAMGQTIRRLVPAAETALKWPNDVFLGGRKVCGILVETPATRPARLVLGVGLNVNNSTAHAPPEVQSVASSLRDVAARNFDRTEVLASFLTHFASYWQQLAANELDLVGEWRPHCLLANRTVSVVSGGQTVTGVCQSIDAEGALLLASEAGTQRVFSGVVAKFE